MISKLLFYTSFDTSFIAINCVYSLCLLMFVHTLHWEQSSQTTSQWKVSTSNTMRRWEIKRISFNQVPVKRMFIELFRTISSQLFHWVSFIWMAGWAYEWIWLSPDIIQKYKRCKGYGELLNGLDLRINAGKKCLHRCDSWRRTKCKFRIYVMHYAFDKICLSAT